MNIRAGTARRPSGRLGDDADVARVAASLEADVAVDLREQRVVPAATDVQAGLEARAALPHEDAATGHELAAEPLDAEHLRVRVTAVARAADAFFVRHVDSDLDGGDANRGRRLAMAPVPPVILAAPELHDGDLAPAPVPDDLARDLRGLQRFAADHDLAAVARDEQHGAELDLAARIDRELLHGDHLPGRDPVLLASRCDHGFHRRQILPTAGSEKPLSDQTGTESVNFGPMPRAVRCVRGT